MKEKYLKRQLMLTQAKLKLVETGKFDDSSINVKVLLATIDVREEILRFIETSRVDAVFIGCRGFGMLKRQLMGSLSTVCVAVLVANENSSICLVLGSSLSCPRHGCSSERHQLRREITFKIKNDSSKYAFSLIFSGVTSLETVFYDFDDCNFGVKTCCVSAWRFR
jgi:hypothetical protein